MSGLVKNTVYYLVGNVVSRLGTFLLLPLYTTHLSPEKFGILELIYTITAFLSILFGDGIAHTTIRFYFDFEAQTARNKVIVTSLLLGFGLSACGSLVVGLNATSLSSILFDNPAYDRLLQIALIILIFELSIEVLFAYIRARQRAIVYVFASTAKLIAQISLSIYLVAYLNMGIEGVLLSNLFCICVVWIILLVYVLRECGYKIDLATVKPMLRYLIPFASSSLLGVLFTTADRFLINHYLGLEALGIYSLSMKFALVLTFLIMLPIQKSFGPYRFEIMKSENAGFIYSKLNIFIVSIASIFILGMAYFIEYVIQLMSSSEYHTASVYVPVLLLGVLFHAITYSFQTGILISKRTTALTKITFYTVAISILLNLYLIPSYGLFGAATSFLVAGLLMASLTLFYSQRLFRIAYDHKPIVYTILTLVGLILIGLLFPPDMNLTLLLFTKILIIVLFSAALVYANKKSFVRLYEEISKPI